MKTIKFFIVLVVVAIFTVSCGSLANMSDEDAYNVGYGIGTVIRSSIDN